MTKVTSLRQPKSMNSTLQTKLETHFPWFNTIIECDDGWYELIYNCLKEIEEFCKTKNKPYPEIAQIKEKYSSLRIYTYDFDLGIDEIIDKYESMSKSICEHCGSYGQLSINGGYYRTLCEDCRSELRFELR